MRMFITSKNKYLSNDMKIFGTCYIPLTLNVKGTKYMVHGFHKKLAKMTPIKLDIAGKEIERVVSFKYLGVWLDECHLNVTVYKFDNAINM